MLATLIAQITNPVIGNFGQGSQAENSIASILATVIRFLTVYGGIAMLLYLLIGGIRWISSGGDKAKLEEASAQITQAITGMIILAATIAITTLIGNALGLDILNPGSGGGLGIN